MREQKVQCIIVFTPRHSLASADKRCVDRSAVSARLTMAKPVLEEPSPSASEDLVVAESRTDQYSNAACAWHQAHHLAFVPAGGSGQLGGGT
jgi:hypothetical protein